MQWSKLKGVHSILILAIITVFILLFYLFGNETTKLDARIIQWVEQNVNEGTVTFFATITHLGSTLAIAIIGIFFLFILWWRNKRFLEVTVFIGALLLGNGLNSFLKDLIGRPRPASAPIDLIGSYSFPSGHTMASTILYLLIAYILTKEMNSQLKKVLTFTVAAILIFFIGISRVIVQAHYLTDIIGGFAFGFIFTYFIVLLYESMISKKEKQSIGT